MLVDNPLSSVENTAGKIPGFLLSGSYVSSGAAALGEHGCYWSKTAFSARGSMYMLISASSVSTRYDYEYKYIGNSVRCIAK